MTDDAELLRDHAAGRSQAAFAELVRRHLDLVYFTALRGLNGDAHLAEDVSQVVFIKLAHNAALLSQHPMLAGWLHTTTHHAAVDALRAEVRRRKREEETQAMHELNRTSEIPLELDRLDPVIDGILQELNRRDREAVLLRFFQGRPFAEIGARLGLGENAARMRVDRALERMRGLLARRGITSTVAALDLALAGHAAMAAPIGVGATVTAAAVVGTSVVGVASLSASETFLLMSTPKTAISAAGALAVILGLGIVVWHQERSNARFAREEADSTALNAGLTAKIVAAEQSRAQSPASASQPPAVRILTDQAKRDRELLLNNPEYAAVTRRISHRNVQVRYGAGIASLNLPPATVAKLKDLLTEKSLVTTDAMAAAREAGLTATTHPSSQDVIQRAMNEADRQIVALIGADDAVKLEASDSVIQEAAKDQSLRWAGVLADEGVPLTENQAVALQRMLAEANNPAVNPNLKIASAKVPDPETYITPNQQGELDVAAAILAPAQAAAIRRMEADENHFLAIQATAGIKYGPSFQLLP